MKNIRFCNQPSNKFSGKHFRPNNFPLSRIFSQKRLFHIFEDIFVGTKFSYQSYDFDSQFDSYRVDIWQDHIFFFAQDENNSEKKRIWRKKKKKKCFSLEMYQNTIQHFPSRNGHFLSCFLIFLWMLRFGIYWTRASKLLPRLSQECEQAWVKGANPISLGCCHLQNL